jgi:hypothetical protein
MSPTIKTLFERAGLYRLSEAEREGVERGLKAMREGRFASDERMASIFEKAARRMQAGGRTTAARSDAIFEP